MLTLRRAKRRGDEAEVFCPCDHVGRAAQFPRRAAQRRARNGRQAMVAAVQPSHVTWSGDTGARTGFWNDEWRVAQAQRAATTKPAAPRPVCEPGSALSRPRSGPCR